MINNFILKQRKTLNKKLIKYNGQPIKCFRIIPMVLVINLSDVLKLKLKMKRNLKTPLI